MKDWKQVFIKEETHKRLSDLSDRTGTKIQHLADRIITDGLNHTTKESKNERTDQDQRTSGK